jgi:membrane protease YdiL (CAAX protease family)
MSTLFTERAARRVANPAVQLVLAGAPLVLAGVAVLEPAVRWPALAIIGLGFALLFQRGELAAWLWAAVLPLTVRLVFAQAVPEVIPSPGLATCGDLLSPVAIRRLAEATLVLATLGLLAGLLGADRASLGLRWPPRPVIALAVALPLVAVPLALLIGPTLARPFFGEYRLELTLLPAVVPAVVLALANGTLEELLYRGAIQGWGSRVIGPGAALLAQAVLFGMAHGGSAFIDPLGVVPVMIVIGAAGLLAGVIVQRTGSLLLPIAVHVALDVPLYYSLACRLPS